MGLVEVRNVRKVYHRDAQEVPVLDGLSLEVAEGDFVALMGPSGSGKTTLLNLIGGIDQPTSGEVTVKGDAIGRLKPGDLARWRSRHIGFVFQLYNLIPVLTALQNVELPLLLADEPTGDLDRKSGEEILGLLERLNKEFKKTIVMVTHDPHAAERAHRVLHLDKGVLSN